MSVRKKEDIKYVYDIPYEERQSLCKILDITDKWENLASLMGYDVMTIKFMRRARSSPTDELLTEWGHGNGTIVHLFGLLSSLKHYQAMSVIKKFVDPKYHRLIYEGKGMLSQKKYPAAETEEDAGAKALSVNLNQSNSCNVLPSKMEGMYLSSEAESKILNVDKNAVAAPVAAPQPAARHGGASQATTLRVNNNNNDPRRSPNGESSRVKDSPDFGKGVESGPPLIKYKELEIATRGWDSSTVLGRGGFGIVYKCNWKNTPVAVKKSIAKESGDNPALQLDLILAELQILNAYRHDSVLPLYGVSVDGPDPCLIYQFMPNGSLEDRLLCRKGTAPLTWIQRHDIATETARGLQWLHTIKDKPLIHGDIKSANILLDSNYQPKIGDFGLAREGPQSQYTHLKISRIHGTRPYLPDEFLRARKLSTKVDTHCFGIVLFELATGLRPYDDQRKHKYLRDYINESTDEQISNLIDRKAMSSDLIIFPVLIDLGKICVKAKPKERPEMVTVLQALEGAKAQLVRAQQQQQQANCRSPSPFMLQEIYDQRNQRRNNISPDFASVSPRNRSPLPLSISPLPDTLGTGRMWSPVLESPRFHQAVGPLEPIMSVNSKEETNAKRAYGQPFPATPPKPELNGGHGLRLGPTSPLAGATAPNFGVASYFPERIGVGKAASPAIAVTPPSDEAGAASGMRSDSQHFTTSSECSSQPSRTSQYSCSGVSFNIPNIPALGIATADRQQSELAMIPATVAQLPRETTSPKHSNPADTPTTAKGKSLCFISESETIAETAILVLSPTQASNAAAAEFLTSQSN